ncbi:MAG TPA: acyl-CoA thioesterase domain-containing protein, partial [Acidimicrobiia bacterium]|nr:acyl-CoA thioesterase domain-containing protein [Acidimicrobiia bacterium]
MRGDLLTLLDLERLDRDLFRGENEPTAAERLSLYGGQVAAQALRAAGATVPGERIPHSLHGYFLRRGKPEMPVLYHVDRDRDGGSFSARHVRAVQDGEGLGAGGIVERREHREDDLAVLHGPHMPGRERAAVAVAIDV